jgi:hypothetical protein
LGKLMILEVKKVLLNFRVNHLSCLHQNWLIISNRLRSPSFVVLWRVKWLHCEAGNLPVLRANWIFSHSIKLCNSEIWFLNKNRFILANQNVRLTNYLILSITHIRKDSGGLAQFCSTTQHHHSHLSFFGYLFRMHNNQKLEDPE